MNKVDSGDDSNFDSDPINQDVMKDDEKVADVKRY